ncbi:peptidylprolyl isomerase [Nonomuraea gerenzanensis]|uniref:peptidylprolyl isomerase n=1 Tax=Nonomuraea gerenzanensis TaxID=93944 RepID=UPI001CDA1F25|nr:peptidyl-prolyl cis-trans isomerase [Nonomuraea gerenzanensis]UBU14471.1 peptidyl-prolyl cis-trans isomerase [Nonomuraea gerenzanensis]
MSAESTDLFVGTPDEPHQVLPVTAAQGAHASALERRGAGVRLAGEITVPAAAATLEVPLIVAAAPGSTVPCLLTLVRNSTSDEIRGAAQVASPRGSWTMLPEVIRGFVVAAEEAVDVAFQMEVPADQPPGLDQRRRPPREPLGAYGVRARHGHGHDPLALACPAAARARAAPPPTASPLPDPAQAGEATPAVLEPLGAITLGSLPSAIAEALQRHPYGTLVGPVEDSLGWHVAIAVPAPRPDREPDGQEPGLLRAARQEAFARWLDDLRAKRVRLMPGLEHPGGPRQPDNHHEH